MALATTWPVLAVSALVGAIMGSFLNVCIHRVPRGESVVKPPSACPACGVRIAPHDNIPVVSWLLLRGRCRSCRAPISPRYAVVEVLTAGTFVLLAWHYGLTWELLPALYFCAAMIVVTLIDYDARIIPDLITLSGVPLGLLATLVTPVTFLDGVIGAAAGFLLFLGIAIVYQKLTGVDGMGGGDIKLAAMLGAFLGWQALLLTFFLASLAGTVVGLTLMIAGRGGRRTALPFGAFLAPAAILVYIWGGRIVAWYGSLLQP